jgi:plastocyanin
MALTAQPPKTYEIITDKDNTFKVTGLKKAVITAKAGEVIKLKVIGHKGTEWAKDGSVHSITINALKDQGWDLPVKEGVNEFTVVAPSEPGEYTIECTVKCGDGHDDMKMKLVVTK